MKITEIEPRANEDALPGADFADCWYAAPVSDDLDPRTVASRLGTSTPRWVRFLMRLRNRLVRPFGLVTGDDAGTMRGGRVIFPVISSNADRVVLGLNDRHLDFRLVIEQRHPDIGGHALAVTTFVRTHNLGGRLYMAMVKPFHRIIVPVMIRHALRPG